jgi:hypothetical protein
MNLLMAPALVSLAAVGLLVLAVGLGLALQLGRRSASAGRALLWYSSTALFTAILFAWVVGVPLCMALAAVFGDWGARIGLWGAGPLGLFVGLVWAHRHPEGQHAVRRKPLMWWLGGATAFALLGVGLWLAWQGSNAAERPDRRIDFWSWLGRTAGLK